MANLGLWAAVCAALLLIPIGFARFNARDVTQGSQAYDDELATRFFAHQAAFDGLLRMLVEGNAGHVQSHLQQISVESFQYFPRSGKLILVPDGADNPQSPAEYYLYTPKGSPHRDDYLYGRGTDIVTSDRPLNGGWSLHREVKITVAVTPY